MKAQNEIFERHKLLTALGKKYPGQYVAMIDRTVLAMGKTQLSVLKNAEKKCPTKKLS